MIEQGATKAPDDFDLRRQAKLPQAARSRLNCLGILQLRATPTPSTSADADAMQGPMARSNDKYSPSPRTYARQIVTEAASGSCAFAAVPREAFLGRGLW
jgi:hypothetical protein